jgi:hypothetical protein
MRKMRKTRWWCRWWWCGWLHIDFNSKYPLQKTFQHLYYHCYCCPLLYSMTFWHLFLVHVLFQSQ